MLDEGGDVPGCIRLGINEQASYPQEHKFSGVFAKLLALGRILVPDCRRPQNHSRGSRFGP